MSFLEKAIAIREGRPPYPRRINVPQKQLTDKDVAYRAPDRTPPPPGERTLVDGLLYYLGILLRYKWIIMGFTTLAAVGVVVFAYISLTLPPEESPMPNYYEATAHLLMNVEGASNTDRILASLGVENTGQGPASLGQIASIVLRSRITVDRLVEEFDIHQRYEIPTWDKQAARDVILSSSYASFDPRAGSLWIGYQDIYPEVAYNVVVSMIRILDEWFIERGGSTRAQQLTLLETKLEEVSGTIDSLESEIRGIQAQYRVLNIGDLAEAQNTLLNDLRSQQAQKRLEIQNYTAVSRLNDPRIGLLRVELQNLTNLIEEIETGNYSSLPAQAEIPDIASRFARLSEELALQQRIYQTLSEQYEVARLADIDERAYEILEAPEIPQEKAGPARSELVLMVVAGAFFGSIALALLINWIQQIKNDPDKLRLLRQ